MDYLRTFDALSDLCAHALSTGRVALDIEFVRERSYTPQLALIQIAVGDTCAIIDPLEIPDLSPLISLVSSPNILKVLHAAGQDMEVLYWQSGKTPAHIFDTQIAAALVGIGDQLSYGRLVELLLGVTLTKGESYSDWLLRPLSSAQLSYAVDDVRYLPALYDILSTRLVELDRTAWAVEEFQKYTHPDLYQRQLRTLFRRIRRGRTLSSQGLAILRELAEWREREAQQRDCPPGSVMRDEAMVALARKAPRSFDDLQRLRGLPRRELEQSAQEILQAVTHGLAVPEREQPKALPRLRLTQTEKLMVKLLDACLGALCQQHQLSAACVGNHGDLEQLVYRYRRGRLHTEGSRLLEGWRGALIGEELLAVLAGHMGVHLDQQTGTLYFTARSETTQTESSSTP
jgi:ribonuclease D